MNGTPHTIGWRALAKTSTARRMLCAALAPAVLGLLLWPFPAQAAEPDPAAPAGRQGPFGGRHELGPHPPHLTDAQREAIKTAIQRNNDQLIAEGTLSLREDAGRPELTWPLRADLLFADYGYHGLSNFVDQNTGVGLQDYECNARTYETHQGTDYFLWPFEWLKMDNDVVAVVAAAPGTISLRQDGNFDRSCSFGGGPWNAVYVTHEDGSVAWYGHLKKGTVTAKTVGESVERGEYLGIVGSSGSSTAPHLHLEIYDAAGFLIDPYTGVCNDLNPDSWWKEQRPYYDSAINKVATGFSDPVFPECPQQETPNTRDAFSPGDTIYFSTYYRDQLETQISTYTIRRPDGTVYDTWTHNSDAFHYAGSYWYWYFENFAPGGPNGIWRFEVDFESRKHVHAFTLDDPGYAGSLQGSAGIAGRGLAVERADDGSLTLSWDGSCLSSDTDFEIYQGRLGEFYSHEALRCTTGNRTSAGIPAPSQDAYFLVVPSNNINEGSYGRGSDDVQRPVGIPACLPQGIAECADSPDGR